MISVEDIILPNKPLSNFELVNACKKLHIPHFRGVCLRDTLPKKPWKHECGILNLDDSSGNGTHWVAWYKNNNADKYYFDSYGLPPPLEVVDYLHSPISYSTEQIQPKDQVICGHLCLYMLKQLSKGYDPQVVINNLY